MAILFASPGCASETRDPATAFEASSEAESGELGDESAPEATSGDGDVGTGEETSTEAGDTEGEASSSSSSGSDGETETTSDAEPCEDVEDRQRFAINIDPDNPGGFPSATQLQSLGVRWVRIEWKAEFGHTQVDAALDAYEEAGISTLMIIDYKSVPGAPSSDASLATWSAYIPTFAAAAGELAAYYADRVDAWEVWNEPDLFHPGQAYDPGVPTAAFADMLAQSYAAIGAYSEAPVVMGGLASGLTSYVDEVLLASGGQLAVDAIGVHPYGQRAPDSWPDSGWGFGDMSTFFDNYGVYGLPLWVTEIGTLDEPVAAQYLPAVYELAASRGADVPYVFWFCWGDAMVPPFGLLDSQAEPKDAYFAFQQSAPQWEACDG